MPAEGQTEGQTEGAPAQQEANPQEQIAQMAGQIVQQLGPEAAGMLADAIMQMIQSAGQTQQAPPQFARKGGKLQRI